MATSGGWGLIGMAAPWCCLSMFAVVVVCGCGGGGNTASPAPTPPTAPPAADTASAPADASGGSVAAAAGSPEQAKDDWPATLPDDVSAWDKKQYFYKARWEGSPKLKEAVEHAAKRFAREGDSKNIEHTAELFRRLLKSEQTPPPGVVVAEGSESSDGSGGAYGGAQGNGMPSS